MISKANRLVLEAGSLLNLGKYKEALQRFNEALDIDPGLAKAWAGKGTALVELGMHEQALECFDKALKIDSRNPAMWGQKGTCLHGLRQFSEALQCFENALKLCPLDARDLFLLIVSKKAIVLLEMKGYEQALACCEEVLRMKPSNFETWLNIGYVLARLNRDRQAIECFDKVLQINPKCFKAWTGKGISLSKLKKFVDAILCLDKALEIDSLDANSWKMRAYCLFYLKRHEEALQSLGKAIEIRPEFDTQLIIEMGTHIAKSGDLEQAILYYDLALRVNSREVMAWYNKGFTLALLGRLREALACANKCLEIASDYEAMERARALKEFVIEKIKGP